MTAPVLYSYRRCPYAMRARMALHYSGIEVVIREIALRQKPAAMLSASPKGTVPVLVLSDGAVIDESLDIMRWALAQRDPQAWLKNVTDSETLIAENDGSFKQALDRYKYAERFPEHPQQTYRVQGELFLSQLETHLQQHAYLLDAEPRLADIAIFPFVRQFAAVDPAWWEDAPYPALRSWLAHWAESALFDSIMQKYPVWVEA
jgi:glutathione S-transferase